MDFSNIACWIWPLIAGIICGILGYLLGRLFSSNNKTIDYSADLDACKRKTASLQADLDACTRKTASLQADLASSESKLSLAKKAPLAATSTASIASSFAAGAATGAVTNTVTENTPPQEKGNGIIGVPFDAAAAKSAYGKKKVRENDLTIVEGIGPKISELFHNHDIKTWAALANTPVQKCQEVLNSGGKRYEIHRPGTWPMQAEMAALGKWAELKKWQDEHDYGKA